MSGLTNMNARILYQGGRQQQRMNLDKLNSLKHALLYSYQAATYVDASGKEFRCLINPDKNKPDYDNKILSIPYQGYCLNDGSPYDKSTDIKCGQTFIWKQTKTHWLIYLQYLEETAYFRADIRRCDHQVNINGTTYWAYVRGPDETAINWAQKAGIEWSDLNYSMIMLIGKDSNTQNGLHRFSKIKVQQNCGVAKTWQVAAVNPYYGDGIIQVMLKETFEDTLAEARAQEKRAQVQATEYPEPSEQYIDGPLEIEAYASAIYTAVGVGPGSWAIEQHGYKRIIQTKSNQIGIENLTGKAGKFKLYYNEKDGIELSIDIFKKSF